MMDNHHYLDLLKEFALLLDKPENSKYITNEGTLDYTELMVESVCFNVSEVPPEHKHRIIFVHDELSSMLEKRGCNKLNDLQGFLQSHGYNCTISHFNQEVNFLIKAPTFDLTIIID